MGLIEFLDSELNSFSKEFKRPFVTLTYAQSLDGSIAVERGKSLKLSNVESLKLTHQLRASHQAILVGIGTILSDDPRLTVRLVDGVDPQAVVLDTSMRIPTDAAILNNKKKPWVMVGKNTNPLRLEKKENLELKTFSVANDTDEVLNLDEVLKILWAEGVGSLMVEGGAKIIQSFLKARLVDLLILTISPIYVGGLKAVENNVGVNDVFPQLEDIHSDRYGSDLVVWGKMINNE